MTHYAFRLSYEYDSLKEFVIEVAKVCSRIIIYEHHSDTGCSRTHIHGLLMDCEVTSNTLKNWVKKVLNMTPQKTDWSFVTYYTKKPSKEHITITEQNHGGTITYQSKGSLNYKFNKGFTEEFINECKSQWIEHKKSIYVNGDLIIQADAVKTKNKKTQYEVASEIRMWCIEQKQDGKILNKNDIIKYTIYIMRNNNMLCHYRQVANIVQDVYQAWDENYFINKISDIV